MSTILCKDSSLGAGASEAGFGFGATTSEAGGHGGHGPKPGASKRSVEAGPCKLSSTKKTQILAIFNQPHFA